MKTKGEPTSLLWGREKRRVQAKPAAGSAEIKPAAVRAKTQGGIRHANGFLHAGQNRNGASLPVSVTKAAPGVVPKHGQGMPTARNLPVAEGSKLSPPPLPPRNIKPTRSPDAATVEMLADKSLQTVSEFPTERVELLPISELDTMELTQQPGLANHKFVAPARAQLPAPTRTAAPAGTMAPRSAAPVSVNTLPTMPLGKQHLGLPFHTLPAKAAPVAANIDQVPAPAILGLDAPTQVDEVPRSPTRSGLRNHRPASEFSTFESEFFAEGEMSFNDDEFADEAVVDLRPRGLWKRITGR